MKTTHQFFHSPNPTKTVILWRDREDTGSRGRGQELFDLAAPLWLSGFRQIRWEEKVPSSYEQLLFYQRINVMNHLKLSAFSSCAPLCSPLLSPLLRPLDQHGTASLLLQVFSFIQYIHFVSWGVFDLHVLTSWIISRSWKWNLLCWDVFPPLWTLVEHIL